MKFNKFFNVLLCGAMLAGFTACENGNEPNNDGSGDNSGNNNTPTFDLKVDVEPVVLGLPSGTLWAPYNVGAKAPEEFGHHFAWAETEPKENYSVNNYKYGIGDDGELESVTKYCVHSEMGTVDGKMKLEPQDDAAMVNWGGDWRTPTDSELQELVDNCTWEWATMNGVKGYKVIGKNGNSIFLPAAGWRFGTEWYDTNIAAIYNSSILCSEWSGAAFALVMANWSVSEWGGPEEIHVANYDRGNGYSVRPVCSRK